MKRLFLFTVLALLVASVAQAVVVPEMVPGTIYARRGYGSTTGGTTDSSTFLLRRLTTDGTASGIRDTLTYIDVSNWDRNPLNAATATAAIGTLFVTFNNAGSAGSSGDSIGVEWRGSIDGTNWTTIRTVAWYVQTAGVGLATIPIFFDADSNVSGATNDVGLVKYMQPILLGDSSGKQVVSSVQAARLRYLPN